MIEREREIEGQSERNREREKIQIERETDTFEDERKNIMKFLDSTESNKMVLS